MTDERLPGLEPQVIQSGWDVYSSDGERVGTVGEVEQDRFALELEVLAGTALTVPMDDVESADNGRVELDVPAESIGGVGWELWPES